MVKLRIIQEENYSGLFQDLAGLAGVSQKKIMTGDSKPILLYGWKRLNMKEKRKA